MNRMNFVFWKVNSNKSNELFWHENTFEIVFWYETTLEIMDQGKTRPHTPSHALTRPHTPSALLGPKPHALSRLWDPLGSYQLYAPFRTPTSTNKAEGVFYPRGKTRPQLFLGVQSWGCVLPSRVKHALRS